MRRSIPLSYEATEVGSWSAVRISSCTSVQNWKKPDQTPGYLHRRKPFKTLKLCWSVPCSEGFRCWQRNCDWGRCIQRWVGCLFASRGRPSGLRITFVNSSWVELCSIWGKADGNSFCPRVLSVRLWLASKDSDRSHATRISHKKYLNQQFPRFPRTLLKLKRISLDTSYQPGPKNSCSRCLIQSLSAIWVNRWRPLVWYESVSALTC